MAVVAAQFLGALADNALLITAIGLLAGRHAAEWATPALRLFFYLSFVLTAAFAGAVADAFPKGRVLLATNLVKLGGCALLLAQLHPLAAYALVGLGAAAHSPARYGILPELLPAEGLVAANAWIEVATVLSILLGVALGSWLLVRPAWQALGIIGCCYLLAVLCTCAIPKGRAANRLALDDPRGLLSAFGRSLTTLWRDAEGQIALAVTSLFWAAAAVLQFVVLRWAQERLGLTLAQAALLQIAVALGMAGGAVAAARWIRLGQALAMLPVGICMGLLLVAMNWVGSVWLAVVLLTAVGAMAGLFVIPMNALLQHRGQQLMHPGQSIAVQNFNENLASLVLLGVYGGLVWAQAPIGGVILAFGVLVAGVMLLIVLRHRNSAAPFPGAAGAAVESSTLEVALQSTPG
ncbi:MAG: lysophospholipid transporter LplT [Bdellovibrionales bacterium]|nr:lysophospholipid transporter LplT [Ramlibacter sp.]